MILLEEPGSSQDCATRANHELAYRATDLVDCHCIVQGWQSGPGVLWTVNQNYSVKSPILNLDRVLASKQVTFSQGPNGSRTEIDLCTPQALAFSSVNIAARPQPGEPAYSAGTPAQGARLDAPDN